MWMNWSFVRLLLSCLQICVLELSLEAVHVLSIMTRLIVFCYEWKHEQELMLSAVPL